MKTMRITGLMLFIIFWACCANGLKDAIIDDVTVKEPHLTVTYGTTGITADYTCNLGYTSIGKTKDYVFFIENTGSADLNLTGEPRIGLQGNGFEVTKHAATPIAAGSSSDFIVRFSPLALTAYSAQITIESNDPDMNVIAFTIKATGSDSEINIKQGSTGIANHAAFDFGDIDVGNHSDIVFTVENSGGGELDLNGDPLVAVGGTDALLFTVTDLPDTVVASQTETTFTLRFSPDGSGAKTAEITIANNDGDEDPYCITVNGTGRICNAPVVSSASAYTYDMTPTWTWDSGGGSACSGNYRYKLDNSDLSSGTTQITGTSYTPGSPLSFGSHTLYVQESNLYGAWSDTGSYDITISAPQAPTVTGDASPTFDTTPTWNWTPGAGGNGTYRYKLDNSDLSTGATVIADTTYTPGTALSYGNHTLYVQASNTEGYYSTTSGSFTIRVVEVRATGYLGSGSNGWKTTGSSTTGSDYQSFYDPNGVYIYSDTIYIAERSNHRISKWTNSTGTAVGWIGGGSNGWKTATGTTSANNYQAFNTPFGVCVDTSGNIYVADTNNNRICKWNSSGNAVGWIGGGSDGWKTTTGATAASDYRSFNTPQSVFADSSGYIYVADTANNRISKWDSSGNAVGWIGGASNGWKTTGTASLAGDYQSFANPRGVWVNSSGTIYISDQYNHRVSQWSSAGNAVGWIGWRYSGWQTGACTPAAYSDDADYRSFNSPCGICLDGAGNIYVTDMTNDRVCRWNSSGTAYGWIGYLDSALFYTLGGGGWLTQDGGQYQCINFGFYNPRSVFVDSSDNIYIADECGRIIKWEQAP